MCLLLILPHKQLLPNMKLVHVKDSEFNTDSGDVTVHKVILFSSILEIFFNFIGIKYNFYIFGIYTHVVYWESFTLIYPKGPWRASPSMICVYTYFGLSHTCSCIPVEKGCKEN